MNANSELNTPETSVSSPQMARFSNRAILSCPFSEQVSGTSRRCLWSEAFRVAPASQFPCCSQSTPSQCECCSVSSETLSSFPVPTGCKSNSSAEHKRPRIMCSLARLISLKSHQIPLSFYTWAVLCSVDNLRCSSSRLQPCAYSSPCCKCPLSLAFPIPLRPACWGLRVTSSRDTSVLLPTLLPCELPRPPWTVLQPCVVRGFISLPPSATAHFLGASPAPLLVLWTPPAVPGPLVAPHKCSLN